jgi:hypothetical protein
MNSARAQGFGKLALDGPSLAARGLKRMRWGSALAARSEGFLRGGEIGKSIKATAISLNAQRRGIGDFTTSSLRKSAFDRLSLGRDAVKRGLMSRIQLDDVKQLSERAVRIPKLMQLQAGKGPIVSKANSWRKLTQRGGKFEDAERALADQVAVQIPFQAPGTKTVTFREKKACDHCDREGYLRSSFKDGTRYCHDCEALLEPEHKPFNKTAGMFGRRVAEFTGLPGDLTKKLVEGRIGKRLELDALSMKSLRGG